MTRRGPKQTLQLGTRVFHPAHGVATVVGVEERSFGAGTELFFSLLLIGGERVLVPVDKVEKIGLRDIVSAKRARKLLTLVHQAPTSAGNLSKRARVAEYDEGLRSGNAEQYTAVLQRLLFRARTHSLALEEKRFLSKARGYFIAEISTALEIPTGDVENMLRSSPD